MLERVEANVHVEVNFIGDNRKSQTQPNTLLSIGPSSERAACDPWQPGLRDSDGGCVGTGDSRRRFSASAALTIGVAGFGMIASAKTRSGERVCRLKQIKCDTTL
jgi:hypothetical protein